MRYLPHLLVGAAVTAGAFALLIPMLASGDEPVSKPDATAPFPAPAATACGSVTFESPGGDKVVIARGMCSACVVHCAQTAERELEQAYAELGLVDDEAGAPILGSAIECTRACTDD